MSRAAFAFAATAWGVLVAHLLFIPYAYVPIPLDDALAQFRTIHWVPLGSDQNVALVSRGLMFVPLGAFIAGAIAPHPQRLQFLAFIVAVVLGAGWSIGVNFAQLWFPTRTVVLNLVAAEVAGVTSGALLWTVCGAFALHWRARIRTGGHVTVRAMLSAYVVLYLLASLTPFDFVTNMRELDEKIASGLYGWWIAPVGCGYTACQLKFFVVFVAAMPCGWWFALHRGFRWSGLVTMAFIALVVTTTIEALHFLMVSGVSQGASVVVRSAGMTFGYATFALRGRISLPLLSRVSPWLVLALLPPYLVAVAYIAGWFRTPLLDVPGALARLHQVIWMPFYYQYFAPYQSTMQSTLVHAALYAPVGFACWLLARPRGRGSLWTAAFAAGLLAYAAETSKIFLAHKLPDYTDVLIAITSAVAVLAALRFVSQPAVTRGNARRVVSTEEAGSSKQSAPSERAGSIEQAASTESRSIGAAIVGIALVAVAAFTALLFPVARVWLLVGLAAYAVLLARYPYAYLFVVPASMFVLDLAPISGRFFWDELDAMLAVTLGVRLWMRSSGISRTQDHHAALWLLAMSVGASTLVAVFPLASLDANAFASYLSPYNALRVAKGYLWAGAMLWLVLRDAQARIDAASMLELGLASAFAVAALTVLLERITFAPGSGAYYRASGLFSATHVGGAYMEAALVLLAPFCLARAIDSRTLWQRALWSVTMLAGGAALVATVSRAALAAFLLALAVFALTWFAATRRRTRTRGWSGSRAAVALAVGLLGVAGLLALTTQSTYVYARLATASADLATRVQHWKATVALLPRDVTHVMFGAGLGLFPRSFYLDHVLSDRLPGYRIDRDPAGASYLALTGGHGLFIDQRLFTTDATSLVLTGRVRSPQPDALLAVSLCAKSFLNSIACDTATIPAGPEWRSFEQALRVPRAAREARWLRPSVALSLHNEMFGSRIDVTGVSLLDGKADLLRNGAFVQGFDHWFFTADNHLAWRAHNTPLQIAFEQGLLGVLAWLAVAVGTILTLAQRRLLPTIHAAAIASLVGVAVVGMFDTLLDAPRLVLLIGTVIAITRLRAHDASATMRVPHLPVERTSGERQ